MKIVIVTGQTATGKTKLALKLAKKENGVLINSDSRQVYKHLNIITGKESSQDILLNDIVDPKEYFSSYDYINCVLPLLKKLLNERKTPIIVGGTYFYLKHLLYRVETENIPQDWALRKKLNNISVSDLQQLLKSISSPLFDKLNQSDKSNPQRLIRKVEIVQYLKNTDSINQLIKSRPTFTIILHNKLGQKSLTVQFIGLRFKNKDSLATAIKKRVEDRLKKGAINEAKNLMKLGYSENDPGLKTIGYQQIIRYLRGELTKDKAINEWTNKEIQYAKRQLTFMKKDPNIIWRNI